MAILRHHDHPLSLCCVRPYALDQDARLPLQFQILVANAEMQGKSHIISLTNDSDPDQDGATKKSSCPDP